MTPLDLFIQEIHQHPAFPELLKRIEESRPVLPEFDPLKDNAEAMETCKWNEKGF